MNHGRNLITKSKPSSTLRHRTFIGPKSFLHRSSSRHSKKSLTTADVSQEDALFFRRLPEKVKRGQFTIEEQILLAGQQDTVIPDATDELLYKLGGKGANRSVPSLQSSYSDQSSAISIDIDDLGSDVGYSSEEEMDTEMLESFMRLESGDLDLTLDDYHVHIAETADAKLPGMAKQTNHRRRQSIMNISSHQTRRPSGSFKTSRATPAEVRASGRAPTAGINRQIHGSKSSRTLRDTTKHYTSHKVPHVADKLEQWGTAWVASTVATDSEVDPTHFADTNATYYLNPEARLKLRHYLASQSKFDEAIEFGFPCLRSPTSSRTLISSRRPSTTAASRHKAPSTTCTNTLGQTFLDDATTTTSIQPSSIDGALGNGTITSWSPSLGTDVTVSNNHTIDEPSLDSFRPSTLHSARPRASVDTHRSRLRAMDRDPHPFPWSGREMTLRMTLTRPDLRADESVLYPGLVPHVTVLRKSTSIREKMGMGFGNQAPDNDLLKLEGLRVGDEAATTTRGKEGGFRRFFGGRK